MTRRSRGIEVSKPWLSGLGHGIWAIAIGLLLSAWLFPCEGVVSVFAAVPLAWGWMLVGIALLVAAFFQPVGIWRWSWCDVLVGVLMVWVAVATAVLVTREAVFARAGLNVAAQFWGFGFLYVFGRIAGLSFESARGLIAFFIGATAFLATAGIYDYAVEMPATRKVYFDASEAKKQEMLLGAGIVDAAPESRERKLFEDRFRATEPLATFAHTNSLATVVSMGFIVLAGWLVLARPGSRPSSSPPLSAWVLIVMVGVLVLMLGCLVLTKSRTSWLAVAMVSSAFVLYRTGLVRTLLAVVLGGVVATLSFIGLIAVGVLDVLVFKEAAKSLLYRVEYWQATLKMMADNLWFGVGLGSFQDRYPRYQLPQASETVSDPHNFLLEAGATLGLVGLALVISLLTWMVWISRNSWLRKSNTGGATAGENWSEETLSPWGFISGNWISWTAGIFVGLIVATFLSLYSGLFPSLAKWLVGLPVGVSVATLCYFKLPFDRSVWRSLLTLALAAWGISLLVAGGFSSWNVAQFTWLLLGGWVSGWEFTALENQDSDQTQKRVVELDRRKLSLKLAGVAATTWFAWSYAVQPTLQGWQYEQEVARSLSLGSMKTAQRNLAQWHQVDPWSELAWQKESQIAFSLWQQSTRSEDREKFLDALAQLQRVRPDVAARYRSLAPGFHAAYCQGQDPEDLAEAIRLQERVTELAPNEAIGFAQLAYWLDQAGEEKAAAQAAGRALELDELNPHADRALKNLYVLEGTQRITGESAEQICLRLRSQAFGTK
jgi:hypothetical protein